MRETRFYCCYYNNIFYYNNILVLYISCQVTVHIVTVHISFETYVEKSKFFLNYFAKKLFANNIGLD